MSRLNLWPAQEKPREKLISHGATALSDAELLAIFLRTGIQGKNVIELSREILLHFGNLKNLFAADMSNFCQIKGLGQAKYVQLQACLEMSQRYLAEHLTSQNIFNNPDQVKAFVQSKLKNKKNEVFAALFMDNQHQLISYEELFFGTINASTVHPRVVLQRALELNCAAVIICHNHPSGVAEVSLADLNITQELKQALAIVDVRLLDHLIVASHSVISLAETGQI